MPALNIIATHDTVRNSGPSSSRPSWMLPNRLMASQMTKTTNALEVSTKSQPVLVIHPRQRVPGGRLEAALAGESPDDEGDRDRGGYTEDDPVEAASFLRRLRRPVRRGRGAAPRRPRGGAGRRRTRCRCSVGSCLFLSGHVVPAPRFRAPPPVPRDEKGEPATLSAHTRGTQFGAGAGAAVGAAPDDPMNDCTRSSSLSTRQASPTFVLGRSLTGR